MIDKLRNYTTLFILIIPTFVSCGDNENMNENTNTDNQSNLLNSKINVNVSFCENLFCTQSKKLSNIEVKLKIDDSEPSYKTAISDEFGEMDQWYTLNYDDETPRFMGLEINGKKYTEELILDRRSGIDIPQHGIVYNKEEGIVHTYTFGTMQYTYAYGFDLIP